MSMAIDLEKYSSFLDGAQKQPYEQFIELSEVELSQLVEALEEAKEIIEFYLKYSLTEVESAEKSEEWLETYFPTKDNK